MRILDLSQGMPDTATMADFLADLIYVNYAYNRDRAPTITPERWKGLFPTDKVDAMERRYQAEHSRHFIEASEEAALEADRRHDERRLGDHA